jgi:hypothetical protein
MDIFSDPSVRIFLFGLAGSAAVEALKIVLTYEAGRALPARYSRKGFWIARICLAISAGVLAVSWGNQNAYLAFYIGASFPAFLESASRNPPDPPNSPPAIPSAGPNP